MLGKEDSYGLAHNTWQEVPLEGYFYEQRQECSVLTALLSQWLSSPPGWPLAECQSHQAQ